MKASDAIAKLLLARGIHTCFELVGGMITHLIDSFANSGQFSVISMHHEQAAAFAAEGVARAARGKTAAVAMGTSGPGATNLITGIGSCWFDSVPCIFITGQVNTNELKGDLGVRQQGFQELDIVEMVRSVTKYAVRVDNLDDLLPQLHRAVSLAFSGRQGPVLLDIPNDIQRKEIPDEIVAKWISQEFDCEPSDDAQPSERDVRMLDSLCQQARCPLICVGGGARWSASMGSWLKAAERYSVPYVSTLMGHERVPAGESYFNMIGTYGNREANWAVQNCDLLVVLGARLDVRQTGADVSDFARRAKIIQVDLDAAQLNNRVKVDLAMHASTEAFFRRFSIQADSFSNMDPQWISALRRKRDQYSVDEYPDWKVSPSRVFALLNKTFQGQGVDYVCDVGNHQMWAAQGLRLEENQAAHYSGGMGAMGFALPTAIGISIQSRRKSVVVTGDGSLQINSQELDTLSRLKLDVIMLVMNNASLGMVKNFQDMYFDGRDQSTRKGYSCPSFVALARAYGIASRQTDNILELEAIFHEIKDQKGPMLIEVLMEGATECRPRLAFGRKLDEQLPLLD